MACQLKSVVGAVILPTWKGRATASYADGPQKIICFWFHFGRCLYRLLVEGEPATKWRLCWSKSVAATADVALISLIFWPFPWLICHRCWSPGQVAGTFYFASQQVQLLLHNSTPRRCCLQRTNETSAARGKRGAVHRWKRGRRPLKHSGNACVIKAWSSQKCKRNRRERRIGSEGSNLLATDPPTAAREGAKGGAQLIVLSSPPGTPIITHSAPFLVETFLTFSTFYLFFSDCHEVKCRSFWAARKLANAISVCDD